MNTDPIADFLTRIRNASRVNKKVVEIPSSNMKAAMAKILFEKGYIANYKVEEGGKQGVIKVALKYNPSTKVPAITKLEQIGRASCRERV